MTRPAVTLFLAAILVTHVAAEPRIVTRAGTVQIEVDTTNAHPGGLFLVWLRARTALGPTVAAYEGQRAPFFSSPQGLRAMLPVPLTVRAGNGTLGIEIRSGRGRRRIPVEVSVGPVPERRRTLILPDEKRGLLLHPSRVRDSRLVLGALRTRTPVAHWRGTLQAPVAVPPEPFFGSQEDYPGAQFVPLLLDGIFGDHHRGLDYPVPGGTVVQAPAAGTVLLARELSLTGKTLVLDHGQGLVSAFFHLSAVDVAEGSLVEARSPVGASGESGLAVTPHLHWGTYLHGVAVDPRILMALPSGF